MKKILSLVLSVSLLTGISAYSYSVPVSAVSSSSSNSSVPSAGKEGISPEIEVNKDIIGDNETDAAKKIIESLSKEFPDRITESEANLKAGEFIKEQLEKSGYTVEFDGFSNSSSRWKSDSDGVTVGINIVSTLKNPDPSKKNVIFVSHNDSFLGSPGANDNGTGVAANLICAEYLKDKELSFNPVFLFVDAEELGLLGSQEYVKKNKESLKENTLLVINTDMTGMGNIFQIVNMRKEAEDSKYHQLALKTGEKLSFNITSVFMFGSDYAHFETNGIPAIGLANDSGVLQHKDPYYHTPNDTYEHVYREAVRNTLVLLLNIVENVDK